eukprot:277158_1
MKDSTSKILTGAVLTGVAAYGLYHLHRYVSRDQNEFSKARERVIAQKRRLNARAPPVRTVTVDSEYESVHNEREAILMGRDQSARRGPSGVLMSPVSLSRQPVPSRFLDDESVTREMSRSREASVSNEIDEALEYLSDSESEPKVDSDHLEESVIVPSKSDSAKVDFRLQNNAAIAALIHRRESVPLLSVGSV